MKTIIIGGTGLLGQHTAVELLARGHHVTLVTNLAPGQLLPGLDEAPVRVLDVWAATDADLRELFAGHDACVYALGPDDRSPHPAPAAKFLADKLVGQTERILAAARAAGVQRAVVLGSYFVTWSRMHPELQMPQIHPYVRARIDQAARAVAAGGGRDAGGMDVCVLEIPYVFGVAPGVAPIWKEWLFDRLKAMRVVMYPVGGSSVVTAAQVGQAAAAACEVGAHDARYPLADEQLTWAALLKIVLPALGKPARVVGVPRVLAEPSARAIGRGFAKQGLEAGLDARYLMRHVMYQHIFVDPVESLRLLRYRRGGVEEAIHQSIAASYSGAAG